GTETITLDTLDRYAAQNGVAEIDYLKIDVEGHELAVLRGARGLIRDRRISVVQMEYGGTWIDSGVFLRQAFEFFAPYGSSAYKVFPARLLSVPVYHPRFETFALSTWVFARPGALAPNG